MAGAIGRASAGTRARVYIAKCGNGARIARESCASYRDSSSAFQNASLPLPSEVGHDPEVLVVFIFTKLGTLLMPLSSLLPRKARAMQDLHQGYVPARTTKAETPKMMVKELASLSSAGASASGVLGSAAELEPFERVMSELKGLGCWSTVSSMMEETSQVELHGKASFLSYASTAYVDNNLVGTVNCTEVKIGVDSRQAMPRLGARRTFSVLQMIQGLHDELSMVFGTSFYIRSSLGKAHGDQVQVSTQSELTTSFGCTGPHHGLGTPVHATLAARHRWSLLSRSGPSGGSGVDRWPCSAGVASILSRLLLSTCRVRGGIITFSLLLRRQEAQKAEERKGERTVATQVMGKVSISWSNARLLGLAATATTEHAVITRLREAAADLHTEHAWILG
ncbi:uncharacterized protein F5891DRAFT_1174604 [Suillus fuscotomentosus]|uniref:Uncharacterized protein n=1 Tax=Suillus fuscotomentosus TaxID=1912939 RepID=A0AAD4HI81_9AGAM|nr:uncharacterized protein F5891DRAFT_1174604 [Suillus fuscotomentosus]KAG1897553.1 hypothetical protein F5891DRAFT_1174604 [Suillus fuscotomentosus]